MNPEGIIASLNDEQWFKTLTDEQKGIASLILKYHNYFSKKDAHYRCVVRVSKIIILFLAMVSTIVLGLRPVIKLDIQVTIGMIVSAFITFVTAVASYFNFEEYWMRNIKVHIHLNILRDEYRLDALAKRLDDERMNYYKDTLKKLQRDNIEYWERIIKK